MPPRGFRFITIPLDGVAEPIVCDDDVILGAIETCCIGMPVLCIWGCTACIGLIDCIGKGWGRFDPLFTVDPLAACKPTAVKPFEPFWAPPEIKKRIITMISILQT